MLDVGTLIGGPILGAIIDTAGWGPMYITAGVGLGVATVVFARWDDRVTHDDGRTPAYSVDG
jgi:hypothetical protein